jgi:glycosyltransferase involved in cell wall biosynthesis
LIEEHKLKNIGIIAHEVYPIKSGGSKLVSDIIKNIDSNKFRLFLYLPENLKYRGQNKVVVRNYGIRRGEEGGLKFFEFLKIMIKGSKEIQKIIVQDRLDLLISIFVFPNGYIANRISKINNIKHIGIVDAIDLPSTYKSPLRRMPFANYIANRVITRFNKIIVIAGLEYELKKVGINDFEILPVNCDVKKVMNTKLLKQSEHIEILVISRLIKRKRIDLSIRLVHELNSKGINCKLNIVGSGPEKLNLQNIVKELKLGDKINFVGEIEESYLEKYYMDANIYLTMAENEGISLALVEAMTYGLICIARDTHSNKSVIINGINGIIVEGTDLEKYVSIIKFYEKKQNIEDLNKIKYGASQTFINAGWEKFNFEIDKWII